MSALDTQPALSLSYENGIARISFYGSLWSADAPSGPWSEIIDAEDPHVLDLAGAQKFYRAGTYGTNSLFSSDSVVKFSLSGAMQTNFDLAFAGIPDGIIPPVRLKPYFVGTLVMPGLQIPVSIRVRGNSSLQECPFPKLKFKVASEYRAGTPFFDAREVKIGTHCAEGGQGRIGRLRDQRAAFREVLAYEVLDLMGFIAPRVRRAQIEYNDTTPATNSTSSVGWQIRREALLAEDIEVLAARLGGRALSDEETTQIQPGAFDVQLTTDMRLFEALIGNWDYALATDTRGVWNTEVIELPAGTNKTLVPIAGDFDLASWVTGIVRHSAPRDYHPEMGDVERETLYQLEQVQKGVPGAIFSAARARFAGERSRIESLIVMSKVDGEGRTNAMRHVAAFYEALKSL